MVFVDCRVLERKGGTASLIKLLVKEEELLINIVNKAISKLIKSTNIEHINDAFKRIKAVTCNGCNFVDVLRSLTEERRCFCEVSYPCALLWLTSSHHTIQQ